MTIIANNAIISKLSIEGKLELSKYLNINSFTVVIMTWQELYRPTVGKLIIPVLVFLFQIYQIILNFGSYFLCKTNCQTNIVHMLQLILTSLGLTIILIYPVSCWIYAFTKWIINKIEK